MEKLKVFKRTQSKDRYAQIITAQWDGDYYDNNLVQVTTWSLMIS